MRDETLGDSDSSFAMHPDWIPYLRNELPAEWMEYWRNRLANEPALRDALDRLIPILDAMDDWEVPVPPAGLAKRTIARAAELPKWSVPADWSYSTSSLRMLDFAMAASVLAVLALLFIPGIATLRDQHSRILCSNQLRSIGVAMGIYSSQEGEHFPYVPTAGPLNNAGSFAWALRVRDLLTDPVALICPSANSAVVRIPLPEDLARSLQDPDVWRDYRRWMSGSYGYSLGYWEGNAFQHGRSPARSARPIVSDRPPRPEEGSWAVNSPNHMGLGQNVLYSDGNVRWFADRRVAGDDLFCNQQQEIGAGLGPSDIVIGVSESTPTFFRSL